MPSICSVPFRVASPQPTRVRMMRTPFCCRTQRACTPRRPPDAALEKERMSLKDTVERLKEVAGASKILRIGKQEKGMGKKGNGYGCASKHRRVKRSLWCVCGRPLPAARLLARLWSAGGSSAARPASSS